MTIPITNNRKTSSMFEAVKRNYLSGEYISAWCEELILQGYEYESVIDGLASFDLHWEKIKPLFLKICCEIGLSNNVYAEIDKLIEESMIEEYKSGLHSACALVRGVPGLREKIGFPQAITSCIELDGSKNPANCYYITSDKSLSGAALENELKLYLKNANIV